MDPAEVGTDGPAFLALVGGDPAYPVLVCEGTGEYENYMLTVGRGIPMETGDPFVYYHWTDCFFSRLVYPEESASEHYAHEILSIVAGEQIWPVQPGNT